MTAAVADQHWWHRPTRSAGATSKVKGTGPPCLRCMVPLQGACKACKCTCENSKRRPTKFGRPSLFQRSHFSPVALLRPILELASPVDAQGSSMEQSQFYITGAAPSRAGTSTAVPITCDVPFSGSQHIHCRKVPGAQLASACRRRAQAGLRGYRPSRHTSKVALLASKTVVSWAQVQAAHLGCKVL